MLVYQNGLGRRLLVGEAVDQHRTSFVNAIPSEDQKKLEMKSRLFATIFEAILCLFFVLMFALLTMCISNITIDELAAIDLKIDHGQTRPGRQRTCRRWTWKASSLLGYCAIDRGCDLVNLPQSSSLESTVCKVGRVWESASDPCRRDSRPAGMFRRSGNCLW